MNMQVLDARRDVTGGYKVDVSRGSHNGRVSSEWFSRPDDERFLSLNDLARSLRGRSERRRSDGHVDGARLKSVKEFVRSGFDAVELHVGITYQVVSEGVLQMTGHQR